MKENKNNRLTVRLTPEQYESIRARAETAHMTPSAFVRAAAMRHKVVVVPGLDDLTHELKGVGRNVNQLTVLAHEGKISVTYLDQVHTELYKIYDTLRNIAELEQR